ncbi:MAG: hypothetical protein ACR2PA_17115 [Hyphomicrobiaceae bacterium]
MTGKVIVAIHVEALKLFFKRIPFIRRPAASRFAVATTRGSKGA